MEKFANMMTGMLCCQRFIKFIDFLIVLAAIGTMGYFWCHCYLGKTFYTYIVLPIIVAIPVMIYSTYLKSENTKIRNFNRLSKFK